MHKQWNIDFKKAAKLSNAEFYFRMMVAMNDLTCNRQISELIKSCTLEKYSVRGLDCYTTRMLQSHIAEACNTFVEKIRPSSRNPSLAPQYKAIQANPKTAVAFAEMVKLMYVLDSSGQVTTRKDSFGKERHLTEQYEQLKAVRDAVGFHYNDQATVYENAITGLYESAVKQPDFDSTGTVFKPDEHGYRFPIADLVATSAAMQLAGLSLEKQIDASNAEYTLYLEYLIKLNAALMTYLLTAIRIWLEENKLLTPKTV